MDIAVALASGAFVGSVLGLVGAGGAMLTVPILLYLFHYSAIHATTASLAVVFIAALFSVIPKARSNDVLYREAFSVWALGLVTNLGGSVLAKHIAPSFITGGFAIILILAGSSMSLGAVGDRPERKVPFVLLLVISLVIGAMTGVFGIGGGFLAIPVLVLFFHTPHNKAAGTSLLIIALNCFTSFVGHHSIWHEVRWSIPIAIAISAVIVSTVASHFSKRVPVALLRQAFAGVLYAIAIFTILKTWFLA
jgi:uncharacterized membrane protein YfcA